MVLATRMLRCRPLPLSKPVTRCARQLSVRTGGRTVTTTAPRAQQHRILLWTLTTAATLIIIAGATQPSLGGRFFHDVHAEEPAEPAMAFEKPRRKSSSKEENRDLISSQHLQVKRSWENPGVYAWGSNTGRVAAPDSSETAIKTPRRIPFFDGMLLRDVKLDRDFGAAIAENGDLLQWGVAFSKNATNPVVTLKGKDLVSLALSSDRIIGLGSDGSVYSIPVSEDGQKSGPRPMEDSWIPFWRLKSDLSYRRLDPKGLAWGERIRSISGGLEHVLLLSSTGRLFSAASASEDFPSRGQLGIPGLTWTTRPTGAYDQPHEIVTLRGFDITKIATGDYHSLAVDREGRAFSFGDNTFGQLGFEFKPESAIVDAPSLLPIQTLYAGTRQAPKVVGVAAGGSNSYFIVDATKVATPSDDTSSRRGLGLVTADAWSCGHGIWGGLGNGRWTHVQGLPTKMPAFSGLFEWDEKANRAVPIRLAHLSVGANHAVAVMDNVTYLNASDKGSENETNWGADILFFGNNEHYQLGTGRRNNVSSPTYIQPLDAGAERKTRGKQEHRFQITPRKTIKLNGRSVSVEQRVECGRGLTAVYSAT